MKIAPYQTTIRLLGAAGTIRHVAAMRRIGTEQAIVALLAAMETGSHVLPGLDIAVETAEEGGRLVYLYIGLPGVGIVAQYSAASGLWHECRSHGNYGRNTACGGTWSSLDKGSQCVPDVIKRIIKALAKVVSND